METLLHLPQRNLVAGQQKVYHSFIIQWMSPSLSLLPQSQVTFSLQSPGWRIHISEKLDFSHTLTYVLHSPKPIVLAILLKLSWWDGHVLKHWWILTTWHCVITQKHHILIYIMAKAWNFKQKHYHINYTVFFGCRWFMIRHVIWWLQLNFCRVHNVVMFPSRSDSLLLLWGRTSQQWIWRLQSSVTCSLVDS